MTLIARSTDSLPISPTLLARVSSKDAPIIAQCRDEDQMQSQPPRRVDARPARCRATLRRKAVGSFMGALIANQARQQLRCSVAKSLKPVYNGPNGPLSVGSNASPSTPDCCDPNNLSSTA